MHGGTITIESEQDYGSCFIIDIPVGEVYEEAFVASLPEEETLYPVLKNSNDDVPGANQKTNHFIN